MAKVTIRSSIVIWDENQHVSEKKLSIVKSEFDKFYYGVFPEGRYIKKILVSSESKFFTSKPLTHFLHEKEFIPYTGKNKDLAIIKYAACGIVDQNEEYRSVIDDVRNMISKAEKLDLGANDEILMTFITSDWASGMEEAIRWSQNYKYKRNHFGVLQIPQKYSTNDHRIKFAAEHLGLELRKRAIRYRGGEIEFNLL